VSPKRISLDVRDGSNGIVVAVTFPTPWGTMKTVNVGVDDASARRFGAKLESILAGRAPRLPPGGA
jgi:hypothetical protein